MIMKIIKMLAGMAVMLSLSGCIIVDDTIPETNNSWPDCVANLCNEMLPPCCSDGTCDARSPICGEARDRKWDCVESCR